MSGWILNKFGIELSPALHVRSKEKKSQRWLLSDLVLGEERIREHQVCYKKRDGDAGKGHVKFEMLRDMQVVLGVHI